MPFIKGGVTLFQQPEVDLLANDLGVLLERCHPDDRPTLLLELRRSADNMAECRIGFRLADPTATYLDIEMEALPQPSEICPGGIEWQGFMQDVSVRRELCQVRRRESLLRQQIASIAEAVPGCLYTTHIDLDGVSTFPFASEGIRELIGLSPEDIRNNAAALRDRYHPDDLPQLFALIKESCRTLAPFRSEIRVIHPERGLRWVDIRSTPRRLPDGTVEAHGMMIDITERKTAELELRTQFEKIVELNDRLEENARNREISAARLVAVHESLKATEAWYRGVLHSAPDGMLVVNEQGLIMLVNAALCRMFGYAERELLGRPIEILLPEDVRAGHPEKRRRFVEQSLHGKAAHTVSGLTGRTRDGAIFKVDVTLSALPVAGSGEVTICVAVRDVSEREAVEQELRDALALSQGVINAVPDILFEVDGEGRYQNVWTQNPDVLEEQKRHLIGRTVFEALGPESGMAAMEAIREAEAKGIAYGKVIRIVQQSGEVRWYEHSLAKKHGNDRSAPTFIALSRDVTDRVRIEEALLRREREFRTLLENTPDTVARFGRDFRRLYVNPAVERTFGRLGSSLLGSKPSEFPGGEIGEMSERCLEEIFASGLPMEFEQKWNSPDGELCMLMKLTPEFDQNGKVESVLVVGRDISELNAFRQKIHQMAFYDPLTGLPNRALFNDRLRQMITDAQCHGQSAGVMMIDMDRFKAVNDTMGHAVGDELLREAAARLSDCVRAYDTVARLGGDEFAILLPEIRSGDDLGRVASKILGRFDERFLLAGKDVFVSCSIGIAVYPDDSIDAQDLMKFADSAMYFAKRSGRNNFRFYSRDLTSSANARLNLESDLRRAIERNELELHYQPKVALQDGRVVGSEALLRWYRGTLGLVPPGEFIQVAEDTGLIVDIGKWVLRQACATATEWNGPGKPVHRIAINLSARQFQSDDLVATLLAVLRETACDPAWIELEITESLLLDEDGKVLDILNGFRAIGVSIAIDDFGTGYSSLSYLARFPIDTLKIDRSFISTVCTDNYRAELVRAILSIARCLGQQVVAEGVETVEQAAFLMAYGCQMAQGFFYSKALPKQDFLSLPASFRA